MTSPIRIQLPERRRQIVTGRNSVVLVEEPHQIRDVRSDGTLESALKLEDSLMREILIIPPRKKQPIAPGALVLRAKGTVSGHEDLGPTLALSWLQHPASDWPSDHRAIAEAWKGKLAIRGEEPNAASPGLREPQVGGIYSILAHWSASGEPATVVMPTGTGKTETMLAVLLQARCPRVLVIVPSNALRDQLFEKFSTLGCLRQIGAIPAETPNPIVGRMRKSLRSPAEAEAFAGPSNVIIATAAVLTASSDEARTSLAGICSHLFVDEAHHVSAPTWDTIRALFADKTVLQFTATPFRQDGKRVDGKIIYNYPLGRAQERGYFRPIDFLHVDELDDSRADRAVAERAVARLREDLSKGLDHLLLVRVKRIDDTEQVQAIYEELAPEHAPVTIHSGVSTADKAARISRLHMRDSRILVCVDMFGEGFDFPQLKVAALHQIHKSLPVTLQFVGRFTRSSSAVGDAAVVVNIADPRVDGELQALYAQDANWNSLLRRTSEGRVQKEVDLQEFIEHFSGDLPDEVPLWNLKPTFSTLIYEVDTACWSKDGFVSPLPTPDALWHADNPVARTCIAVFARREELRWGKYRDLHDWIWRIVIGYHNEALGLLFLHTNDYKSLNCNALAKGLVGDSAELAAGPQMFRVFHGIERPLVKNLGASKTGSVRFTMYFGTDVTSGLSQIEKAESEVRNLAGWGYEQGDRVTLGCSTRGGKAWSQGGGPITDWRKWCDLLGRKVVNPEIDHLDVIQGFLRPVEISEFPSDRVAVQLDWGESLLRIDEIRVGIRFGDLEFKLLDVDLRILAQEPTGLTFQIWADGAEATYRIVLTKEDGQSTKCSYELLDGPHISIRKGSGPWVLLSDWVMRDHLTVMYADGSFSYNQFFVDAPCAGEYDATALDSWDWDDTNIRTESQGIARATDSIQARVISAITDDFEIVFDDDGANEIADVVAIRRIESEKILICFIHCKYSSEDKPGARVDDFYAVCGQAQKSVRWKHAGLRKMGDHMKRRHERWADKGGSRFIKGDMRMFRTLEKLSRKTGVELEVLIVQPGLSKAKAVESPEVRRLLGSTELYLRRTADAPLRVIVSA